MSALTAATERVRGITTHAAHRARLDLRRVWPSPSNGGPRLSAGSGYRPDLQGLRALAVILVALDHASVPLFKGGYVGVDVFFVLSGFLITGLLLAGVTKRGFVSLRGFYARRARRILPAATLTLVVTTIVAYQLLNVVRAQQVAKDSLWASLFAANIHFAHQGTDYFAQGQPPSSVLHYWSLSVEEQFYFVWPTVVSLTLFGILGVRRSRRQPASAHLLVGWARRRLLIVVSVVAIASLTWSIHYTDVVPAAAYFSPFTRAWELALGAVIAILAYGRQVRLPAMIQYSAGWFGLCAIGAATVAYSDATPFPGYAALAPTLGAALVIIAGVGGQAPRFSIGRLFAVAPMRYIGDRSYSFYLWHWPVLMVGALYAGHELEVGMKLLLLVGAFILSVISYRFFENPIRRARWSERTSAALIPASIATVILVTTLTVSSIHAKISNLQGANAAVVTPRLQVMNRAIVSSKSAVLPSVIAAVRAANHGGKIPSPLIPPVADLLNEAYQFPAGCVPATESDTESTICRLGDTSAVKSIVIFGDSHAQMWMPTVLSMAKADAWVVVPIVKSGCLPSTWVGSGYPGTPQATLTACHKWYRWAVRQAKTLRPDVTLVSGCCGGAGGTTASATESAFASFATVMKRVSKNVILVADDDGVSRQPVDCLLAKNATMHTCTTTQTSSSLALNDDLARIAKSRGFGFLKTRGWFCYQNRCPMVVGHTIVYRDTGHITQAYALQLAEPFRASFRRCLFAACPS